jgi:hypothetical protein
MRKFRPRLDSFDSSLDDSPIPLTTSASLTTVYHQHLFPTRHVFSIPHAPINLTDRIRRATRADPLPPLSPLPFVPSYSKSPSPRPSSRSVRLLRRPERRSSPRLPRPRRFVHPFPSQPLLSRPKEGNRCSEKGSDREHSSSGQIGGLMMESLTTTQLRLALHGHDVHNYTIFRD